MPSAWPRWAMLALAGAEAGVCLLGLRGPSLAARQRELRAWGSAHAQLKAALTEPAVHDAHAGGSGGAALLDLQPRDPAPSLPANWLDSFVTKQGSSTDACSAKVTEAKRAMDGLSAKILALSESVEGNEAVIEANTQLIRGALASKTGNDAALQQENQECDATHAADLAANEKFRRELDELDQMASPAVRSSIAHDLNAKAEVEAALRARNLTAKDARAAGPALAARCAKLRTILVSRSATGGPGALNCTEGRAALQAEYTEAYTELLRLYGEGAKLADETRGICRQAAWDKHLGHDTSADVRLMKATRAVQAAKDTIAAFQPLLDVAKDEVQRLEAHLASLATTCVVDADVTAHLKKVRLLIDSLHRCPGRNDFQLTVPGT